MLRRLLGAELQRDPAALDFQAGSHGKPRLAGADAGSGLEFNLSHSGDHALLGCAWRHELGVDIEQWRDMRDEAALVQRYFSPAEQVAYAALPAARRSRGFFQCWTRKEAYVKAVGLGLGLPLDSFDVSLDDGESARLLRCSAQGGKELPWCLSAPDVGAQVSAAVVIAAQCCALLPSDET
jgi:4'-phosphopantetheinyl transferase